jgi:methylamine dehydrogenase accessory protein MauD
MNEALLVSNLVLWVLVVILAVVVVALTRQVGLLHARIAPVGALATSHGPEVGEPVPELTVLDRHGQPLRLGGEDPDRRRTLLFFLSPSCPVCAGLLPTLRSLAAGQPDLQLVFASDGAWPEHADFVRENRLESSTYVLSTELGLLFEVAKLPFAVLLDRDGILRAKGLVNTREHLESLFEAEALGVGSLQQYLEGESLPVRVAS